MTKKKNDVLDEEVKAITNKWKTTGDVRATLAEQMQLAVDGKGSPELSSALTREAAKVTRIMEEQRKEMKKQIAEESSIKPEFETLRTVYTHHRIAIGAATPRTIPCFDLLGYLTCTTSVIYD